MAKRNPHVGSSFDDFLSEEGLLEEATAVAVKRVIAWQISEAMKQRGLSKSAMANLMNTSRPALDRLLNGEDTGVTLETLTKAAQALHAKFKIELALA